MKIKFGYIAATSTLVALIFLSGCATERLAQFSAFATAGSQYVAAFHQLIAQAGSATIAEDSLVLATEHNLAGSDVVTNPTHWEAEVKSKDEQMQESLATLQTIDEHATQLGSYFDAISNLTNGKAASGTAAAATDLLNSIGSLNSSVKNAKFLGQPVQKFVTTGTDYVVANFEVKALDDQLNKAKPVIEEALSLQEAAVAAIGSQLQVNLKDALAANETNQVIDPFLKPTPLPDNWNTNREAFLRAKVTVSNLDSAQAAIKQLHVTFKELLENKSTSINLTTLLNDVSKMAGYVASAEAASKTSTSK